MKLIVRRYAPLACALLGVAGCPSPGPHVPPANVVLISIDTLRADHLGCYGYRRDTSPNLDSLAVDAVRFANARSVSSWTLPAHASLLTGLYPAEHGVETDLSALPPSARTLASVLAEAGYDTFAAVSHVYLTARWGFERGFEHFDESAAMGSAQRPVAGRVVESALAWLDSRGADAAPFFMWLHIFDPHWDYAPPEPYASRFDADYRGPMTGHYKSLAPYIKAVAGYDRPPALDGRDLAHVVALYDGEIAYVDAELGRLFTAIRSDGLFDNTLVVVVSDHGEEFMEHGSLEGHQWTLYEEVVRVPLIMRFPERRPSGRVVDALVSTVAVGGTILDYLGIDNDWPDLGTVARPGLFGARGGGEALLDLTVRHRLRQVGLQVGDWKLIRAYDGTLELYRKPQPGSEHDNLAEAHADKAAELSRRIDRRLAAMQPLADRGAKRKPLDATVAERLRATGYLQ